MPLCCISDLNNFVSKYSGFNSSYSNHLSSGKCQNGAALDTDMLVSLVVRDNYGNKIPFFEQVVMFESESQKPNNFLESKAKDISLISVVPSDS